MGELRGAARLLCRLLNAEMITVALLIWVGCPPRRRRDSGNGLVTLDLGVGRVGAANASVCHSK
jgi:hypothetical protein